MPVSYIIYTIAVYIYSILGNINFIIVITYNRYWLIDSDLIFIVVQDLWGLHSLPTL